MPSLSILIGAVVGLLFVIGLVAFLLLRTKKAPAAVAPTEPTAVAAPLPSPEQIPESGKQPLERAEGVFPPIPVLPSAVEPEPPSPEARAVEVAPAAPPPEAALVPSVELGAEPAPAVAEPIEPAVAEVPQPVEPVSPPAGVPSPAIAESLPASKRPLIPREEPGEAPIAPPEAPSAEPPQTTPKPLIGLLGTKLVPAKAKPAARPVREPSPRVSPRVPSVGEQRKPEARPAPLAPREPLFSEEEPTRPKTTTAAIAAAPVEPPVSTVPKPKGSLAERISQVVPEIEPPSAEKTPTEPMDALEEHAAGVVPPAEEPAAERAPQPFAKPAEAPRKPTPQPFAKPAEAPRKPTLQPVAKPVEAPHKPTPQPFAKPAEAPRKPTPQPFAKPAEAPRKPTPQPFAKPVEAARKLTPQPVAKPAEAPRKPTPQPFAKPAEAPRKLTPQPVAKPAEAPRKPTPQPVAEPAKASPETSTTADLPTDPAARKRALLERMHARLPGAGTASPFEKTDPKHQDARRIARLFVSEIVLYNQELVEKARKEGGVYSLLKKDIDHCRQAIRERIPDDVSAQFDYLYDEIIVQIAHGDESKLGPDMPAPTAPRKKN